MAQPLPTLTKRNLAAVAILPIVTLGIYWFVWLVRTKGEINAGITDDDKVPTAGMWIAPPIGGLTIFILSNMMVSHPSALFEFFPATLFVLSCLASTGLFFWWLWLYAGAAEKAVDGDFSQDLIFWLGVVCILFGGTPIWMLVMQSQFNQFATSISSL